MAGILRYFNEFTLTDNQLKQIKALGPIDLEKLKEESEKNRQAEWLKKKEKRNAIKKIPRIETSEGNE